MSIGKELLQKAIHNNLHGRSHFPQHQHHYSSHQFPTVGHSLEFLLHLQSQQEDSKKVLSKFSSKPIKTNTRTSVSSAYMK